MSENNAPHIPSNGSQPQNPQVPGNGNQPVAPQSGDYSHLDQSHHYAHQPQQAQQPMSPNGFQHQNQGGEQTTSKKAIASLVLGIIGILLGCFVPFIGLLGVVLGIVGIVLAALSMKDIKRNVSLKGKGLGIAGLVCSIIALIVSLIIQGVLIFTLYLFASDPELQQKTIDELKSDPELSQYLDGLQNDTEDNN